MLQSRPWLAALWAGAVPLLLLAVQLAARAGETLPPGQPPADLAKELAEAKAQIAELTKRLEEAKRTARQFADRLTRTEKDLTNALAELEKVTEDNARYLARLAQLTDRGRPDQEVVLMPLEARPADKLIRGKVTAVDRALGLAIINVGLDKGVKKGYTFIVLRREKRVGKIRVDEVFPNASAAQYLEACDAEVGDEVTTKVEAEPPKP